MKNTKTNELLQIVLDCIEYDGFTQSLTMFIQHKLSSEDKLTVLLDIKSMINQSPSAPSTTSK